ncbi:MAG: tetratricopeptide (TPR) repeat protein, partial [Myxococcota bacterium]
ERQRTERASTQATTPTAQPEAEKTRPEKPASEQAAPKSEAPTLLAPTEQLSDVALRERTLEREVIAEPTAVRWENLATVKSEQGLSYAAFRSSTEAWWLSPRRDAEECHAQALAHLARDLRLTGSAAAQARQALQHNNLLGGLAYILVGRLLPPGHVDSWVLQAARLLSRYQDDLPKKLRWLAWGEVWRVNLDVRAQASVRTQILADIDAAGLSPIDVPDFLQERLLKERGLTDEQDAGEVGRALTNLESIHTTIRSMPTDLRCGGMAVLARAYQRLGRLDRAGLCMEQARMEPSSAFVTAWIRLFAAPTIGSLKPDGISTLLADLPSFEADSLREVAASLQERQDEDSPLAFLSAKNLSRLYPDTPSLRRNPLHAHLERIAFFRKKNNHKQFVLEMRKWMNDAVKQASAVNSRDIATLVHMAIREISRMQTRNVGNDLTEQFSTFSKQCLGKIGSSDDYFSLLFQLSVAQGSLDLGKSAAGLGGLRRTMKRLQEADCITLDLVDVCAAAIQVLESADLTQRGTALDGLLRALVEQTRKLPDLASSSSTLSILRLLDQLCEASVSKDRITLGRYRRYQDLDELLIRERILSEDHCL